MKLTSLRIISKNIKQCVQFYEKAIGVTPQWYTEDFAELSTSTITIAIGSTRTMKMFGENITGSEGYQSTIIEFMVADVDREYEKIKGLTDHVVQEPTTMPWGNRSLLFRDPDGNLINFFTPVSVEAIQKFK
ncbi:glyoxalase [Chryseobacterium indologenes]|uniref:VOC family protein n=1 Tax=Chryseobacterium indologenes TaxID=253 RepID=UPI000BFE14DA|nr:VOC family protein [Chryseobacterium indologenes]ATN04771.1 glyoxalase [Chryseobacterium indologenes]AYY86478.1 VOC family protein [Chryseobacterium indologenes]QIX83371.1 VOC family protein [Chryseobacterium indologenes]UDQ53064.1 VOC family protein [Chryseobacterium indologenes]